MRTIRDEDRQRDRDESTVTIPDVRATKVSGSGKALLCIIDDEAHWIPQSQIHDDSEVYQPGDEGKLVITRWIAEQKGLCDG